MKRLVLHLLVVKQKKTYKLLNLKVLVLIFLMMKLKHHEVKFFWFTILFNLFSLILPFAGAVQ